MLAGNVRLSALATGSKVRNSEAESYFEHMSIYSRGSAFGLPANLMTMPANSTKSLTHIVLSALCSLALYLPADLVLLAM
jgi:hypothetical protein